MVPTFFARPAVAGLLAVLASTATGLQAQEEALLRVHMGDVHPVVAAVLQSDAVASLLDAPEMRGVWTGNEAGKLPNLAALWQGIEAWVPERLDVVIPHQAEPAFAALLQLETAADAFRALDDVPPEEAAARRESIEGPLLDLAGSMKTLDVDVDARLRSEADAHRCFRALSDRLLESLEDNPLLDLDGVTVTEDEHGVSVAVAIDVFLEALRAFDAPQFDARLLALLVTRAKGDRLALHIMEDGQRLHVDLRGSAATRPPSTTDDERGLDAGLLSVRWNFTHARQTWQRLAALQRELLDSPLAESLPRLASALADTEQRLRTLDGDAACGRTTLRVADRELRLDTVQTAAAAPAAPGAEAFDALLQHVPDGVELFAAGSDTLPEACLPLALTLLRMVEAWPDRLATGFDPAPYRAALQQLCDELAAAGDRFDPGWLLLAAAPGQRTAGTPNDPPRLVPAWAVLAQPKTANSGMWFARNLLAPVAKATGSTIEPRDEELTVTETEASWKLAPAWQPHAFLRDGTLVISSSAEVDPRLANATTSITRPDGTRFLLRTTGRRLAALIARGTELARAVVTRCGGRLQTATTMHVLGTILGSVAERLGRVEATERTIDEGVERTWIVGLPPADEELTDVLERAREAFGPPLPSDRMLVARGHGTFYGAPVELELAYAADGHFREELRGPLGADVAWDGTTLVQDMGWGRQPLDSRFFDSVRLWAAAVSGQWLDPRAGMRVRLIERTFEGLVVDVNLDGGGVGCRLVLDPDTFLVRRFEPCQARPTSAQIALELSEFRTVAGHRLPSRLRYRDDSCAYRLDEWHVEPVDESRFAPGVAPRTRLAADASRVTVDAVGGELWLEGSIGERHGWFSVAPLIETATLTPDVYDALVSAGAPHSTDSPRLLANDVVVGPIHAESGVFGRATAPTEQNGRHVLGYVGTEILRGCFVRFDLGGPSLTIDPTAALANDGAAMTGGVGHRMFACTLRGGITSWWSPVATDANYALLSRAECTRLKASVSGGEAPLDEHGLAWLDAGGLVLEPAGTYVFDALSAWADDPSPIVLTNGVLGDAVLEMDFPHQRYRLVRD